METIQRDYGPKGVQFIYVYKALAHPEYNGYVTPFSLQERLMHVREAERTLGSRFQWICDGMDNAIKHALGDAPNSEFVIGPDGIIVARRAWSRPDDVRRDLERLLGPVDEPTRIADLDLPSAPPPETVATGIVPRPELPGRMQPLLLEPALNERGDGATPFYVKLRAEVEQGVFRRGRGKLYLGFHLDPLYHVHWNNLTDPLSFEIKAPAGVVIAPARGTGPQVSEPADADPREFLLDLELADDHDPKQPIHLTVRYFACDNANTFCIPVEQSYRLFASVDPDGGRAMRGRGRRGGFANRDRGGMERRPGDFGPGRMFDRLWERDEDQDGRLAPEDLPQPMRQRFDRMDQNGDGWLDRDEARQVERRLGGGGRSPDFREGDRGGLPAPSGREFFDWLDSNRDGVIDAGELGRLSERLETLDRDGDQRVSAAELRRGLR